MQMIVFPKGENLYIQKTEGTHECNLYSDTPSWWSQTCRCTPAKKNAEFVCSQHFGMNLTMNSVHFPESQISTSFVLYRRPAAKYACRGERFNSSKCQTNPVVCTCTSDIMCACTSYTDINTRLYLRDECGAPARPTWNIMLQLPSNEQLILWQTNSNHQSKLTPIQI